VHKVNENKRIPYPEGYEDFDLKDKLYYLRSHLPSITHIDYSARIQSVHKETNPEYYELIKSFKNITGVGVVINTSFNVRGEPIVCTPQDAYKCFMRTEMDYLVIGSYIFDKKEQPNFEDKENWKETFVLD
jgi:carbamoyltransferase